MPLSVIGAGLGRTGTTSLKAALETLGFGLCHHMIEVMQNPGQVERWIAAAEGERDWETVFEGYRSAVDWPEVAFWRELVAAYPDAKVILTERDPEAWFRSTQATILAPGRPRDPAERRTVMMSKLMQRFAADPHDHDEMIAAFNAHNAEVRAAIAPDRLLVYGIETGWAPLCEFLGVAVPNAPFPHRNSTEEFANRFAQRRAQGPS